MVSKLFKQMLASQIVSAMAVTLCLLVDSIMIGRFLGVDSVAAYGLANPILLIFAAFGSMLSSGIQVVCSKAMGNSNEDDIHKYYSVSVVVALLFSAIGVALVLIFINPLCSFLGAKEGTEVFELTKDYLQGFILGAPAFIVAQMMVPYLQMSGERTRLVVAVLSMTAADVLFDLLNVYVFGQKMFGMGLASTLSYYIAVSIGLIYFIGKKSIYRFRIKLITLASLKEIGAGGIPTVINQISLVLLVFTINKVMMKTGGNIAVAAYSIVSTIANLGYCIGNGISEVSLMLTGIYYGEEDELSLGRIVKVQTIYAILLDAVATVVIILAAKPLVRLFLDTNPAAEHEAIFGLRLFSICLIPSAINAAFKKYYQAIGRIKFSESISALQNFLFPAIIVIIFGNIFGTKGVWWYYIIGELLSLIYITVYVKIASGKKLFSLGSYICIPYDFGYSPEDVLEFVIEDENGVAEASAAAGVFCSNKSVPRRKSMYVSLCIEEMANNIIKYGFEKKGKNRIDIKLIKKEDSMVIRIRDNCRGFDPLKYLKANKYDQTDPSRHIGIHMVTKMVKNAQYVYSLGLNNLMMEI